MKLFVRLTGVATFSVLFLYAFLFYKERTLTFDMAFQEFYIILTKNFVINLRIGALIPQIIPLVLRWFNCPLKQLLLIHSLGFVVYYFAFFAIITFLMKDQWAALISLLYPLLLVNDTFYWIESELPQGLAFLILYYAYIEKKGAADINRRPVFHFFLLLFIQFFHPLMIIPILFVLLYSLQKTYQYNFQYYIKPVTIGILSFIIRYIAGKFSDYESSRFDIGSALKNNLPHLLTLPSVEKLIHFASGDYLVYWLLFGVTLFALVWRKRWYLAGLMCVFTFGYLLLICITNPAADKFYLENMILPASIFLLLPFADFVLKSMQPFRPAIFAMVISIVVARLFCIYNAHVLYTNRLAWYDSVFQEMEFNKAQRWIMASQDVPIDTLVMTWPSGYETILLSSINGPQHAKSLVITGDVSKLTPYAKNDSLFLAEWEVRNISELPSQYFHLTPGHYIVKNK